MAFLGVFSGVRGDRRVNWRRGVCRIQRSRAGITPTTHEGRHCTQLSGSATAWGLRVCERERKLGAALCLLAQRRPAR
eukprot:1971647-Prymnesium_polylepis.1